MIRLVMLVVPGSWDETGRGKGDQTPAGLVASQLFRVDNRRC